MAEISDALMFKCEIIKPFPQGISPLELKFDRQVNYTVIKAGISRNEVKNGTANETVSMYSSLEEYIKEYGLEGLTANQVYLQKVADESNHDMLDVGLRRGIDEDTVVNFHGAILEEIGNAQQTIEQLYGTRGYDDNWWKLNILEAPEGIMVEIIDSLGTLVLDSGANSMPDPLTIRGRGRPITTEWTDGFMREVSKGYITKVTIWLNAARPLPQDPVPATQLYLGLSLPSS